MARRPRRAQKAAGPSGRSGRVRYSANLERQGSPASRRSARTALLQRRKTPSSKAHKWARKRDAAEGSRREHKRREEGHNPRHPQDFEERERQPANGKSLRLERRTSVNRSPCGRRTSLWGRQDAKSATLPTVYPKLGGDSIAYRTGWEKIFSGFR